MLNKGLGYFWEFPALGAILSILFLAVDRIFGETERAGSIQGFTQINRQKNETVYEDI